MMCSYMHGDKSKDNWRSSRVRPATLAAGGAALAIMLVIAVAGTGQAVSAATLGHRVTLSSVSRADQPAAPSRTPLGPSGSWTLMFEDEFDGTSLNTAKWVTCYPWFNPTTGCTNTGNKELQWYLPGGVSVSNGILKLTARNQPTTGTNAKIYPYTSGMISSGASQSAAPKFSYQYGFVEGRMKVPPGKGYWPAFWALPNDRSWPPEIDVMEYWGSKPGQIMMNDHWKDASGAHKQAPTMFSGDFTNSWHTFGFSWSRSTLVWYVDGVARKTLTDPYAIPVKPMYLILNLAIDGGIPPDATTPFPGTMEVDYVRAWRQ